MDAKDARALRTASERVEAAKAAYEAALDERGRLLQAVWIDCTYDEIADALGVKSRQAAFNILARYEARQAKKV